MGNKKIENVENSGQMHVMCYTCLLFSSFSVLYHFAWFWGTAMKCGCGIFLSFFIILNYFFFYISLLQLNSC